MESVPDSTNKGDTSFKRITAVVAASLGMGLVFDFLFFDKLPGISFPLYVVLTLAALLGAARLQHRTMPKPALFMIPLLVFFSSMVFVRTADFLTFVNVVASFYLLGLFFTLAFRPALWSYIFRDYIDPLTRLPLRVFGKARQLVGAFAGERAFVAKHKASPQVVRGVLIALPVLLIFVLLFSSADLVFQHYVKTLFDFHIDGELFWRTCLILFVAFTFVGLFGVLGREPKTHDAEHSGAQAKNDQRHGLIEASVIFGSLNVLFLVFISIQFAYLFGGASNVVGGDFTYAEYARKGFFELIAVAGLAFLLIFAAERMLLREGQKHDMRFKLLSGMLIVQVMIIMLSALKRLHLYEGAYGYTSLRLYSIIFIAWLAIVLAALLYKIFADRREHVFAFAVFASVVSVLVFVNFLNVDGFVARENIARYKETNKLDVRYLGSLSDDAVTETVDLLYAKDPMVRGVIAASLYQRQQRLHADMTAWQSANVTRSAALQELDKHAQLLEQNKDTVIEPSYLGPGQ